VTILRRVLLGALVVVVLLAAAGWVVYRHVIFTRLPEAGAPPAVAGPYAVTVEPANGSPAHVLYRPADLAPFPDADSLPVLVWANGGCVADSAGYAEFLTTIASHGFLVVTSAEHEGRTRIDADSLRTGIDWTEAENVRAGSALAGRIATDRVAAMGQSCGGGLTLEIAADTRLDTIGVWNAGSGGAAALAGIHTPALYVNGGDRDLMAGRSESDFDAIDHVPVFLGVRRGGGHLGTLTHAGGGEFANVAAAWLRWRLKDDARAGTMFSGRDCGLCTNPDWITRAKGWE